MNGRRARARRDAKIVKLRAHIAAMAGAEPQYNGTLDGHDFFMVGPVLVGVPILRDDYPPELKNAIDRRRRAGLTGTCDCGARRKVGRRARLEMDHEDDCTVSNERIHEIANRHGIRMGSLSDGGAYVVVPIGGTHPNAPFNQGESAK